MKQRTFTYQALGQTRLFPQTDPPTWELVFRGHLTRIWPESISYIVAVNGIQSGDIIIGFSFGVS